ncbi:hypothetical protein ACSHWB_47025 [Lentzea sp. HUAS TT2]|uniref:hypothetical protein n=1 Tax=Lentzea sp. HUAS TT2 TaxID=3447454 RepID=UPI003F6EF71A
MNVPGGSGFPSGTNIRPEGGTLKLENGVAKLGGAIRSDKGPPLKAHEVGKKYE